MDRKDHLRRAFFGAVTGGIVVLLGLAFHSALADSHRAQAIPDGGCVLCWGGADGDTQIGYSTSGKCKQGEEGVVSRSPILCSGDNLTLGEEVSPTTGLPTDTCFVDLDMSALAKDGVSLQVDRHPATVTVSAAIAIDAGKETPIVIRPAPPEADALGKRVVVGPDGIAAPVDRSKGGVVCGVHYTTSLEQAAEHFRQAGFSGIRDMTYLAGWEQGQSLYNCNLMRRKARAYDHAKVCLSYYQGDADWSDGRCSVYRFAYDRFTGSVGDLGRQ